MNGGSSAPYLARTPCVPLFCTLFNRGGNRRAFLDYQGRAGIISIVRWNLRPVIFGVDFRGPPPKLPPGTKPIHAGKNSWGLNFFRQNMRGLLSYSRAYRKIILRSYARVQEKIPGELFMYGFRARGYPPPAQKKLLTQKNPEEFIPKGPFRTKNSTEPESVVFCYRRSFLLSVPFSCLFFLEK